RFCALIRAINAFNNDPFTKSKSLLSAEYKSSIFIVPLLQNLRPSKKNLFVPTIPTFSKEDVPSHISCAQENFPSFKKLCIGNNVAIPFTATVLLGRRANVLPLKRILPQVISLQLLQQSTSNERSCLLK